MKIPSLVHRGRNGFNMTPMIDVVFLLIIFFLVASHLSDQDSQLPLELPRADSSTAALNTSNSRITLNFLNADTLLMGGKKISKEHLAETLQNHIQAGPEKVTVHIRAGRDLPFGAVDPILAACSQIGIWDVSFAVFERRRSPSSQDESP